jgi:carbonic anhydrase/acetyltransferase-like protein (isoleucine patch superfamily)
VLKDGSTVLEHTLVLNGEEVEEDTVIQGWPVQSVANTDDYQASLIDKLHQWLHESAGTEERKPLLSQGTPKSL